VSDERLATVLTARLREPGAFARAASNRTIPASLFNAYGKMIRLLYPPGDDVAAAVDTAVGLLQKDPSLV
jgi:hypothetical protein